MQHVVPDELLEAHALELARSIARHSAVALRDTKRTLRVTAGLARHEAFRASNDIYVEDLMNREDPIEGLGAFLEKRSPTWRHR